VDATTHAKVNSASLLFDLDFKFHDVSQAYSLCPGLMVVSELCRQPMQTGKVKNTPTTCSNDKKYLLYRSCMWWWELRVVEGVRKGSRSDKPGIAVQIGLEFC
jgi:hypothetical protein